MKKLIVLTALFVFNFKCLALHIECQHIDGIQITLFGDAHKAQDLDSMAPATNLSAVENFKLPARLFIVGENPKDRIAVTGELTSKNASNLILFKDQNIHKLGLEMTYHERKNTFNTKLSLGPLPTKVGHIKCLIDYSK